MLCNTKVFLFLAGVVSILGIEEIMEPELYVYAHFFTTDQSVEFLSLVNQIYAEIALINYTFPGEIESSYRHSINAAVLMNKTFHLAKASSTEDFRITYLEELLNRNNSTVQALVVANLVDQTLRKYGDAYNLGFDLANMSNMDMTDIDLMSPQDRKEHSDSQGNSENKLQLVNIEDYQSAQLLSGQAVQIFEQIFKPLSQIGNHTSSGNNSNVVYVAKLENGLIEPNNMLYNTTNPQELMMLVHTQIHPGLQLAYNLDSRNK
jgi:hypothetical protein